MSFFPLFMLIIKLLLNLGILKLGKRRWLRGKFRSVLRGVPVIKRMKKYIKRIKKYHYLYIIKVSSACKNPTSVFLLGVLRGPVLHLASQAPDLFCLWLSLPLGPGSPFQLPVKWRKRECGRLCGKLMARLLAYITSLFFWLEFSHIVYLIPRVARKWLYRTKGKYSLAKQFFCHMILTCRG